jgi:hypothetical protein
VLPHGGPPSHHTATLSFFAKSLRSSQRRLELEVVVFVSSFFVEIGCGATPSRACWWLVATVVHVWPEFGWGFLSMLVAGRRCRPCLASVLQDMVSHVPPNHSVVVNLGGGS